MARMVARLHSQQVISSWFGVSSQSTTSMVSILLRYRSGLLWETKPAFQPATCSVEAIRIMISRSQNLTIGRMPQCGQADSGGCMLGGCRVLAFKAMNIASHNQTLCLFLKCNAVEDHNDYSTNSTDHITVDYVDSLVMLSWMSALAVCAKWVPAAWLLHHLRCERANADPANASRLRQNIVHVGNDAV